ncbi:hypothetical protein D3880_11605 [Pseudomonas cavernae]|uniref:Uncharacterized protein n=1 Tax=Pseudomonas cavernae TaxID=2320867 RepID=A0A385Z1A9_9PSED|nr:hypothetical protein [Pseudomonas cavernae]AYC32975.1 hypothetical protein D3880_11605 [Pseudomonas cavernae]
MIATAREVLHAYEQQIANNKVQVQFDTDAAPVVVSQWMLLTQLLNSQRIPSEPVPARHAAPVRRFPAAPAVRPRRAEAVAHCKRYQRNQARARRDAAMADQAMKRLAGAAKWLRSTEAELRDIDALLQREGRGL